MGNLFIWLFGTAVGAGLTYIHTRQVHQAITREQVKQNRAATFEREQSQKVHREWRDAVEQLAQERNRNNVTQAMEDGWMQGYKDGLSENMSRADAEKFLTMLNNGENATLMMRKRRATNEGQ